MTAPDRALAEFAAKLTRAPSSMISADLDLLRAAGHDDVAIHDATQIVGYFNYINRMADALGVELDPGATIWGPGARDLGS